MIALPSLRRWPRALLAAPIRAYRFFLSPWLGSACRFEPTCSRYGLDALDAHGAGVGSYLAARRVLRCHPWCDGGFDPVPPAARTLTSRIRLPIRKSRCP